jgi:hypothetical protein
MSNFRTSKSLAVIQSDLAAIMRGMNADVDLTPGTVLHDLLLDSTGQEFASLYVLLDYVNGIKSLDGILTLLSNSSFLTLLQEALGLNNSQEAVDLISADLDELASNWGLTRRGAVAARYLQRFYSGSNAGVIQIPVGTTVQTRDGSVIARINSSAAQAMQTDNVLGLYYVEEISEVTVMGAVGNVALGALATISPLISQASSTANVGLVQEGAEEESNADFAQRIKDVFRQHGINTVSGYRALMMNEPVNAQDALVVKPGDALMYRMPAGAVDIYLVGQNLALTRESIVYRAGTVDYLLGQQPASSIVSVEKGGVIPPANYSLVKDTTTNWRGSPKAQDKIHFSDVTGLVDTETFFVQYNYDKRVNDGQNLVETNDDTSVPASDILVRQGTQVIIDISATVVTFGQRLMSDVQTDIQSDFGKFFNGGTATTGAVYAAKLLGESVDWSDIINLMVDVSDVDRVTLTTFVVKKDTVVQTIDPVPVSASEYARAGTVTFL